MNLTNAFLDEKKYFCWNSYKNLKFCFRFFFPKIIKKKNYIDSWNFWKNRTTWKKVVLKKKKSIPESVGSRASKCRPVRKHNRFGQWLATKQNNNKNRKIKSYPRGVDKHNVEDPCRRPTPENGESIRIPASVVTAGSFALIRWRKAKAANCVWSISAG